MHMRSVYLCRALNYMYITTSAHTPEYPTRLLVLCLVSLPSTGLDRPGPERVDTINEVLDVCPVIMLPQLEFAIPLGIDLDEIHKSRRCSLFLYLSNQTFKGLFVNKKSLGIVYTIDHKFVLFAVPGVWPRALKTP